MIGIHGIPDLHGFDEFPFWSCPNLIVSNHSCAAFWRGEHAIDHTTFGAPFFLLISSSTHI